MKIFFKFFGIFALVVLIGFAMAGCAAAESEDEGAGGSGGGGGGGGSIDRKITIKNDTSVNILYLWIKPSTSTDWGSSNLSSTISSGQSRGITLFQSLSAHSNFDIQLSTSYDPTGTSGSRFIQYNVPLSNGTTITFTNGDLDDKSNLPQITIRNRSGVSLDNIRLKPSSASDWGIGFGSVSNNSSKSITIPIPLTNYSVFDIQMTSTDTMGSGTYLKSNVSISNGMTLTIYSTDRDIVNLYPVIVIQNNTSVNVLYAWIKPSASTNWGSNIIAYSGGIASGQSQAIRLSDTLSANSVYDIQLSTESGSTGTYGSRFIKNNVSVSDGYTITFTNSDLITP